MDSCIPKEEEEKKVNLLIGGKISIGVQVTESNKI
jgi:hypothetical protein